MESKTEWRMYFLVMYNLSGIQKGIQSGHAALEYVEVYGDTWQYRDFIKNHKTFILLDGGGSSDMCNNFEKLMNLGVRAIPFYEPDLNDSVSAIAFLVPSEIYNLDTLEINEGYNFEFNKFLKEFRLASN